MANEEAIQEELFGLGTQLELLAGLLESELEAPAPSAESLLADIERRAATCRSFLAAKAEGGDVFMFSRTDDDELRSTAPAPFDLAMASGDSFASHWSGDMITSRWDDGRKLRWVGGRCVISD